MHFLQMECETAFLHSKFYIQTKWGSMVVKGLKQAPYRNKTAKILRQSLEKLL